MSKDKLLSILGASEPQKNKTGTKQRHKKKKLILTKYLET